MSGITNMDEKEGRVLVVGDIHGSHKGLVQAMHRCKFDNDKDQLISLGDIADGWPETPQCVDELLKVKNLIAIKGNHDDWTLSWMNTANAGHHWLNSGGKATKDAYDQAQMYHDHDREAHHRFFKYQHDFYIDDENRAFVHGGFTSRKGVGHEPYRSNYYWDRDMWTLALMQDRNKIDQELVDEPTHSTRFYRHKEVYIGHTSTCNWRAKGNMKESSDPNQKLNADITVPMHRCNVWNMDTGGGFGGKITIQDVDTKEYFQSDYCKELYPNHAGR
tara:strand:- start:5041 stop:5865 length:825 start_codon:yes stop_codon:yes gene_type:complete